MNEISKKKAAHEYALKMISTIDNWDKYVSSPDVKKIARNAWELAEAMEQEYLNRTPKVKYEDEPVAEFKDGFCYFDRANFDYIKRENGKLYKNNGIGEEWLNIPDFKPKKGWFVVCGEVV